MKVKEILIISLVYMLNFQSQAELANFTAYDNESASQTYILDIINANGLTMTLGKSASLQIINNLNSAFPGETAWSIPSNNTGSRIAFIGKQDGALFSINSISVAEHSSPILSLSFRIKGYRNGNSVADQTKSTDGIEGIETVTIEGFEDLEYVTIEVTSRALLLTSVEFTTSTAQTVGSETLSFHYLYSDNSSVDLELDHLVLGREYWIDQSEDLSDWDPIRNLVALRPYAIPYVSLNDYDDKYFLRLRWNQTEAEPIGGDQ